MRAAVAILLVAGLAPFASGFEATASVEHRLDLDTGSSAADTAPPGCTGGTLVTRPTWMKFTEGVGEFGCADWRVPLPVPAGAATAEVRFLVDRVVAPATSAADAPAFYQAVRLTSGDKTLGALEYYAPSQGNAHLAPHAVTALLPRGAPVHAEWRFEDRGGQAGQPSAGSYGASLFDPILVSQVPLAATDDAFEVPVSVLMAGRATVRIVYEEPHSIREVIGPAGRVAAGQMVVSSSATGTELTILPSAFIQQGAGEYTVRLQALSPAGPAWTLALALSLTLLAGATAATVLMLSVRMRDEMWRIRTATSVIAVLGALVYAITREAFIFSNMDAAMWNTLHSGWLATIVVPAGYGVFLHVRGRRLLARRGAEQRVATEVLESHAMLRENTTDATPWRKLRYDAVDAYIMMFDSGWEVRAAMRPFADELEELWSTCEAAVMDAAVQWDEPVAPDVEVRTDDVFVPASLAFLCGTAAHHASLSGAPLRVEAFARRGTATLRISPMPSRDDPALLVLQEAMRRLGGHARCHGKVLEVAWRTA